MAGSLARDQNRPASPSPARAPPGDNDMCKLCDEGRPQNHYFGSRRGFMKTAAATGIAATAFDLLAAGAAKADDGGREPEDTGRHGRRSCPSTSRRRL